MQKELWIDFEGTGRNPELHEPTQVSGTLCDEEFNIFMRPTKWDIIEPDALEVQGKTLEDLKAYPEPQAGFLQLISLFSRHIDKYNKSDKAKIFAYNSQYDMTMLFKLFRLYSPDGAKGFKEYYVGNYFHKNAICVMNAYIFAVELGKFTPPLVDYKLVNVCKEHGIEFGAHDALEDIVATKKLYSIIRSKF